MKNVAMIMSGKTKANSGSGQIWNLIMNVLRGGTVLAVQTAKPADKA